MVMAINVWKQSCGGSTTHTTSDQLGIWTNAWNIVKPEAPDRVFLGACSSSPHTTKTLASSRSYAYTPHPSSSPGSGEEAWEDCRFCAGQLYLFLKWFGGVAQGQTTAENHPQTWGDEASSSWHKVALEHFIMSEEKKFVLFLFFSNFIIWKLSNLQKNCNSTMDTFQLNSVVNSLLHLLSPFLSFCFFPLNPLKVGCRLVIFKIFSLISNNSILISANSAMKRAFLFLFFIIHFWRQGFFSVGVC